ncbi:hypothetical protein PV386_13120 [Streptomyces europaeiscabiei]|nr:hypothetical protein [Streptomyces europaeiscabiei]
MQLRQVGRPGGVVVGGDAIAPMTVPTTVGGTSSRGVTSFTRMENYQYWKISAHD